MRWKKGTLFQHRIPKFKIVWIFREAIAHTTINRLFESLGRFVHNLCIISSYIRVYIVYFLVFNIFVLLPKVPPWNMWWGPSYLHRPPGHQGSDAVLPPWEDVGQGLLPLAAYLTAHDLEQGHYRPQLHERCHSRVWHHALPKAEACLSTCLTWQLGTR